MPERNPSALRTDGFPCEKDGEKTEEKTGEDQEGMGDDAAGGAVPADDGGSGRNGQGADGAVRRDPGVQQKGFCRCP